MSPELPDHESHDNEDPNLAKALETLDRAAEVLGHVRTHEIIEAYTVAMQRIAKDPNAEADGAMLTDTLTAFEIRVRTEVEACPGRAIELFVTTLHEPEPEARLLSAYALDKLALRAPYTALELYERLLNDEAGPVSARAAVTFSECAHVLVDGVNDHQLFKQVLTLAGKSFPRDIGTIYTDGDDFIPVRLPRSA